MENGTWTVARVEKDILRAPQTQQRLVSLLPPEISPERFALMALDHCRDNPAMLTAIQADGGVSFLSAVVQAAEVGLSLNKALGLAALTPRKGKVAFAPMYRGLIHLARASGQVIDAWADVVYAADKFTVSRGTNPQLVHEPDIKTPRLDANIVAAYACARLRDCPEIKFEYQTLDKILKCRDAADSWSNERGRAFSPWTRNFPEMCKKTAVRQLCNLLQLDGERWEKAIQADNDEYDWKKPPVKRSLPLPGTAPAPEPDTWVEIAQETAQMLQGKVLSTEPVQEPKKAPEAPSRFVEGLKTIRQRMNPFPPPDQYAPAPAPAGTTVEKEEKTYEEKARLVGEWCMAMTSGDRDAAGDLLEYLMGFQGSKGWVNGVRSIADLKPPKVSEKWMHTTYGKVKDAHEKWLAEREVRNVPAADELPPSVPEPTTGLLDMNGPAF